MFIPGPTSVKEAEIKKDLLNGIIDELNKITQNGEPLFKDGVTDTTRELVKSISYDLYDNLFKSMQNQINTGIEGKTVLSTEPPTTLIGLYV